MNREGLHLTSLDLDGLHLGLTSAEERARLQAHVESCGSCARLRSEHDASVLRFRSGVFDRTIRQVKRRSSGRRRRVELVVGLAAAAALVLLVRGGGDHGQVVTTASLLATKGEGSLQVFARRGQQVFAVKDGETLSPGDAIRFFLGPSGKGQVIIGSVDGAGIATIYFPYGGRGSAAIAPDKRFEVPGSIVLDHAPGPERIFAVFSPAPMESEPVRQALSSLGARGTSAIRRTQKLPLPGTSQASLLFEKRELTP